jgi:hypothetical protein
MKENNEGKERRKREKEKREGKERKKREKENREAKKQGCSFSFLCAVLQRKVTTKVN